jgi:hypothetical protein
MWQLYQIPTCMCDLICQFDQSNLRCMFTCKQYGSWLRNL